MLQTEFPFRLPRGFVDAEGNLHTEGTMRLATAYDEIAPLKDPRVISNPGYLLVILLARSSTSIQRSSRGCLPPISPICRICTRASTAPVTIACGRSARTVSSNSMSS